jgi:diguanylate cyclase (GGDEF)-like protein
MDFGTFFVTNVAFFTVFTVWICVLAWYNRRATGMMWFAGAQIVGLSKLILQWLEGGSPAIWIGMAANELYIVSIAMQWMGLYWFVVRKPFPHRRLWIPIALILAAYTVGFLAKVPYTGNLINVPFVALCGFSAWTLCRHRGGPFMVVKRVSAAIACGQMCVAAYRAILTNVRYVAPWRNVIAHRDQHWLYSLAAAVFLAACMATCEMWFMVTELQVELARRARTDPLTGALNWRSMEEVALRETARSLRYGNALSMVVVDIDNFKHLNDTRGHAAGDSALEALVHRLNRMLREQDSLARMGGDEFVILLPDTSGSAALIIAERIRQALADLEVSFATGPVRMTVSAGVAQSDRAYGWEEMMRRADDAMYAAKRRGRNRASARSEPEESHPEESDPGESDEDKRGGADADSLKLMSTT